MFDIVRYQRQSVFIFIILSISHLETSLQAINDLGGMVAVWFCFYHLTGIDPNPILEINFEWIHLFVSSTTVSTILNGRAKVCSKAAIHTTVTLFWFQNFMTAFRFRRNTDMHRLAWFLPSDAHGWSR